jgi:hypothetical protein
MAFFLSFLLVFVLIGYQNCSPQMDDEEEDISSQETPEEEARGAIQVMDLRGLEGESVELLIKGYAYVEDPQDYVVPIRIYVDREGEVDPICASDFKANYESVSFPRHGFEFSCVLRGNGEEVVNYNVSLHGISFGAIDYISLDNKELTVNYSDEP